MLKANFIQLMRNRKGLSLVEMMTAIAVTTILVGIITVFVIRAFYTNRYVIEQGLNTSAVQASIRNFITNLREAKQSDAGGYMIQSADDFDLVFFADVSDNEGTERLHYYLENGQLLLGIAHPVGFPVSYPEEDEETRVIGTGIVNSSEQPIFLYYDGNYPQDSQNNPLATPVNPQDVNLVKLDLYMNVNTEQVPNSTHMETFVRPRNIDY